LLGRSVLPVEAQTSLLERAEGNPLYAEEYVRMYRERASAEDLPLPETVQGIIAARLDALPSAEKELLQTAAVMGKVFWTGALAAVGAVSRAQTEQLLHTLDRKEFVRRERRPSLADEVEYSFRHVLVRDVAYSQIPRATRAKGHLGAAEWIESLGRPRDHAEMLAHHFSTALELERTLGHDSSMLAARTRYALHAAGDRAASVKAFPSAVRYYDDALALTPSGPDRLDLVFARAVAAFWTYSDDRAAVLGDAAKELVDAGDVERAAQVEALLAEVEWLHADHAAMAVHLDRAVHFIRPRPSSEAKARVLSQVARQRMLARDVEGALTFGTEALHLAEELGLDQVKAHVLISVGAARGTHGESDAGIAQIQQGLELAKSHDAYDAIGRAYQNLSAIVWHMDFAQCVAYGLEAERAFQRLGPRAAAYPAASVVANLYWLGEWDEAVSRADRLIERHAAGAELAEQNAREIRAQIRFGRDDEQGASADGERALAIARAATDAQSVIPSHIYAAMIAIRSGRRDEASRHCDVALGEPTRAFLHHATIEFALVLQELGRADEIRDELAAYPVRTLWHDAARAIVDSDLVRGADLLAELGMPTLVAHTRLAAARELSTAGRHREADAQLQAALRFFRSVRATRYVREAEALLAAAS
jgi:tetratricopeptide (TPR) repeat protein